MTPLDWMPALPAIAVLAAALLALLYVRVRERGARKGSPFADDFTRAPGHKLRRMTERAFRGLWRAILLATIWPLLVYATWAGLHLELGMPRSTVADLGFSAALVLGFVLILIRLLDVERKFRRLRLALDAEISAGQSLTSILARGCRLVHDVGVPGGRIAHVLVMPSGIHAIRTLASLRRGRGLGRGRDDVTVRFVGDELQFPGGSDLAAVPLARKHAQLLAEQLGEHLGHGVQVRPAVALPGWRVEQQAGSDVRVFNPRDASGLLAGPAILSPTGIAEIADVLETMVPAAARRAVVQEPVAERREPRLE